METDSSSSSSSSSGVYENGAFNQDASERQSMSSGFGSFKGSDCPSKRSSYISSEDVPAESLFAGIDLSNIADSDSDDGYRAANEQGERTCRFEGYDASDDSPKKKVW